MRREWKSEAPAAVGWYVVTGDPGSRVAGEWRSYWNGSGWFGWVHHGDFQATPVPTKPVPSDVAIFHAEQVQ